MMQSILSLHMPPKCGHLFTIGHFDIQVNFIGEAKSEKGVYSRRLVCGGVKTFMF